MNSYRSSHLGETCNRFFDVVAVEHHQVGELINDDDDVRQRAFLPESPNRLGVSPSSNSRLY